MGPQGSYPGGVGGPSPGTPPGSAPPVTTTNSLAQIYILYYLAQVLRPRQQTGYKKKKKIHGMQEFDEEVT